MIVFLCLCYLVVLFLLVKFKVIKLTLFWKISPAIWFFIVFIFLFIPLQWGAPSGPVTLYQSVIQITPNVAGVVKSVDAEGLVPLKKGDVLFKLDPTIFQSKLDSLNAALKLSELRLQQSKLLVKQQSGTMYDVERYESDVENYQAKIREAKWNLESTVVRAPTDGFIVGMALQPGRRVSSFAIASVMPFVNTQHTRLVMGITQTRLRHIKKGQEAEVALSLFPGQIFKGKVIDIMEMNARGQVNPSGNVYPIPAGQQIGAPYGVVLSLDITDEQRKSIYGGASGTGVVYTKSAAMTHIIRKVMIRMETWLNFLRPY